MRGLLLPISTTFSLIGQASIKTSSFDTDIDECANDDLNVCPDNSDCTNLQPGFSCTCSEGFIEVEGNCYEGCEEGFEWNDQYECSGNIIWLLGEMYGL